VDTPKALYTGISNSDDPSLGTVELVMRRNMQMCENRRWRKHGEMTGLQVYLAHKSATKKTRCDLVTDA